MSPSTSSLVAEVSGELGLPSRSNGARWWALRPEGKADPYGVERARDDLETAYAVADDWMRAGGWAVGDAFRMADCAAAPALCYANQVAPFGERRHLGAYYERLVERPSVRRVLDEAKPYFAMFPG